MTRLLVGSGLELLLITGLFGTMGIAYLIISLFMFIVGFFVSKNFIQALNL